MKWIAYLLLNTQMDDSWWVSIINMPRIISSSFWWWVNFGVLVLSFLMVHIINVQSSHLPKLKLSPGLSQWYGSWKFFLLIDEVECDVWGWMEWRKGRRALWSLRSQSIFMPSCMNLSTGWSSSASQGRYDKSELRIKCHWGGDGGQLAWLDVKCVFTSWALGGTCGWWEEQWQLYCHTGDKGYFKSQYIELVITFFNSQPKIMLFGSLKSL